MAGHGDSQCSWLHTFGWTGLTIGSQDLKDFARQSGLDVVYSEVNRERDTNGMGKGYDPCRFRIV